MMIEILFAIIPAVCFAVALVKYLKFHGNGELAVAWGWAAFAQIISGFYRIMLYDMLKEIDTLIEML